MDGGDAREGSYIRKGESIEKGIKKREKRKIVIKEKEEENDSLIFSINPISLGALE